MVWGLSLFPSLHYLGRPADLLKASATLPRFCSGYGLGLGYSSENAHPLTDTWIMTSPRPSGFRAARLRSGSPPRNGRSLLPGSSKCPQSGSMFKGAILLVWGAGSKTKQIRINQLFQVDQQKANRCGLHGVRVFVLAHVAVAPKRGTPLLGPGWFSKDQDLRFAPAL